jgi:hypothetical protein
MTRGRRYTDRLMGPFREEFEVRILHHIRWNFRPTIPNIALLSLSLSLFHLYHIAINNHVKFAKLCANRLYLLKMFRISATNLIRCRLSDMQVKNLCMNICFTRCPFYSLPKKNNLRSQTFLSYLIFHLTSLYLEY